jgi:hypothetical protein
MTQSFAEKPELVRRALMHGTRQRQRQHQQTVIATQVVLPGSRNLVAGDCCGDAVGFATLRKAAMQGTPTSRKSGSNAPHRPFHFQGNEAFTKGSCQWGALPPLQSRCPSPVYHDWFPMLHRDAHQ